MSLIAEVQKGFEQLTLVVRKYGLPRNVPSNAQLLENATNVLTFTGTTFVAPPLRADINNPPRRFAVRNDTSSILVMTMPDGADNGKILNITIYPGMARVYRQISTTGYGLESGIPKIILDGLYGKSVWTPPANGHFLVNPGGTFANTMTKGIPFFLQVSVPSKFKSKGARVRIATAQAGGIIRMGAYPTDSFGLPDWGNFVDLGSVPTDAVGFSESLLSNAVIVPDKSVWFAALALNSNVSMTHGNPLFGPMTIPPGQADAIGVNNVSNYRGNTVLTDLPTAATDLVWTSAGIPRMFVRSDP